MPPAQAVSLLASQLPAFQGTQDEDVDIWLSRVKKIALIHGVSDNVKLLAATQKLQKSARDWLDLDVEIVNESWNKFEDAISRRFKRRTSYQDTLQKVESRKWILGKEEFPQYVLQKMKLLQPLRLPQREIIQFLISEKKPSSHNTSRNLVCAYCKRNGHTKDNCYKLKRKESPSSLSTVTVGSSSPGVSERTPATVAATSEESVTESPSAPEESISAVGCVNDNTQRQLEISDQVTEIEKVNNTSCSLLALLDTGSPVSFIQDSVASIKNSPSMLLLGYEKTNQTDSPLIRFLNDVLKSTLSDQSIEDLRDQKRDIAYQATDNLRNYNKSYYDKHHKTPSVYKPGDYVLVRDTSNKPEEERKFKTSYKGPYLGGNSTALLVAKALNKNRYVIQDIPGFNVTQKPYNSILSPDRLTFWIKPLKDNLKDS
ncbi:hypothetical protein ALC62_12748 [Cyphomyrmex costatus]|uniref:Uncharacterized protein n=1 Tax=Cyphomyrmex costatus TaxID=456900 RepID=A0A151IAT3_9HYME|nr:hypothetical protein ALC62_12748 [Cyphomyrmex costatus]